MKKALIALALVSGCGASDQESGNVATPSRNAAAAAAERQDGGPAGDGATAGATSLTGLYEGGSGAQTNQLCMVEKAGKAQFGLIVWGANMHSCSGAGSAVRKGDSLTLTMGGDSTCAIEARMAGGKITLPAQVPAGCSYYCGARAQMTNAAFTRSGSSIADAMKARDLAGDSLCESTGG